MEMAKEMIVSVLVCGIVGLVLHLCNKLVLKPRGIRSKLEGQGIRGPSPSFLLGNIPDMKRIQAAAAAATRVSPPNQSMHGGARTISHDWLSRTFPYIHQWRKEYGAIFVYSVGNIQKMCVTDPEMVKEMSTCTSLDLGKPKFLAQERGPLLGQGILTSNGPSWAHQRKIIAPQFYTDKVKGMVDLMLDSTTSMLRSWEGQIESAGGIANIRVDEDLRCLSADIISRASFGSNYSRGKEIFSKLKYVQMLMSKGIYGIPGLRHVPTKHNRELWRLEKEINSSILKLVRERREGAFENDLLQMILEAAKSPADSDGLTFGIDSSEFIVSNCKSIYFAGHETTAITASWCLMLLSTHPDWQARVRAEVLEICKGSLPDADMLRSMKLLTTVIQETLRLYPPTSFLAREAYRDMQFKDIKIPKGLIIWTPIAALHHDRRIWGTDAHEFKPGRFEHGITKACEVPQAYMPFGWGPRVCVGQHFAVMELKAILSAILCKFQFTLSPMYRHSPASRLVVTPERGVQLQVGRA